jgi:hypothetical protein
VIRRRTDPMVQWLRLPKKKKKTKKNKSHKFKCRRRHWREFCQRCVSNRFRKKLIRLWMPRSLQIPTQSLNVCQVGHTIRKWRCRLLFQLVDAQTGLVINPFLWRYLLKQQFPVIIETRILSCLLGRFMRYQVFCSKSLDSLFFFYSYSGPLNMTV